MIEIVQGTDAWFQARMGSVTASRIGDILAKPETASYRNYQAELVAELLTGQPNESGFFNSSMDRGKELEPAARICYEFKTGREVTEVGYVKHPIVKNSGASPDGMVWPDGTIEIKCRTIALHIGYMISQKVDKKTLNQIYWQQACTGRQWTDFVSYNPDIGIDHQMVIIRVPRDNKIILDLEIAVTSFMVGVFDMTRKLMEMKILS